MNKPNNINQGLLINLSVKSKIKFINIRVDKKLNEITKRNLLLLNNFKYFSIIKLKNKINFKKLN